MDQLPTSVPLSGADWFMLAMDRHMTQYKTVGNVCRYALFLNGRIDPDQIRSRIKEKNVFKWLGLLRIKHGAPFKIPAWICGNENPVIDVNTWESENDSIPDFIFKKDIRINDGAMFYIDLVYIPGNKSIFVFSWHHILMDGRGAGMLLKYLNGDIEMTGNNLAPSLGNRRGFRENLKNMIGNAVFLKESSRKPLASIMKEDQCDKPDYHHRIIKFTREETQTINDNAFKHGSRYGKSPYYLAATTRATHAVLKKRGIEDAPFWIPVPQDERLRGAFGPLISNHLSFIFYRIPVQSLNTLKECVSFITSQMMEQIKSRIPKNYGHMMDWFRRMPLKPYYQLINGPGGGAVASFLFSVAADSHSELKSFFGTTIDDAINFPPNTYPPGFTIVFMRFNGTLKIIINYIEQAISTSEVLFFENLIRKDLLEGDVIL